MDQFNDQNRLYGANSTSGTFNSNEKYIDFNEFLTAYNQQPNNGNGSTPYNYEPFPENRSLFPYYPSPMEYFNDGLIKQSNLIPTATEFIPMSRHQPFPEPVDFYSDPFVGQAIQPIVDYPMNDNRSVNEMFALVESVSRIGVDEEKTERSEEDPKIPDSILNISGAVKKPTGNESTQKYSGKDRYENDGSSTERLPKQRHGNQRNGNYENGDRNRWARDRKNYRDSGYRSHYDDGPDTNWRTDFSDRRSHFGRYDANGGRDESNGRTGGGRKKNNGSEKYSHPDYKPNRNLKVTAYNEKTNAGCSQREKLIIEIDSGRLECMVCCEGIKPFQPTWSCSNCYAIMHLNCVIKWYSSSKSDEGWRCPACQNCTKRTPTDYYCFCGKQKNPQYNRNDVAHSCGDICGRKDLCVHPCTLLCHPGPCPACQATVQRECGCGRMKKIMQCYQKEPITCTERCDKLLQCGVHRCEEKCHPDECGDCERRIDHKCYCGKDKKDMECTKGNNETMRYSCGKTCNRQLSCKHHSCRMICHDGDCGLCKLLPDQVTSCPCGKTPIPQEQRKLCTDPVPLCTSVCGKPLKCGAPSNPHRCTGKCHNGNCLPCNKDTAVRCRCGHMDQMVKCRQLLTRADDARCKKRCIKKRNCGKHKCNQECCIDIDHVCPLPCNYNLSCGKHKCDQTCHKGRCQPCYRSSFEELYCECGANVIYPPVACGTKRPACDKPCSRQHGCTHPVQHPCHSAPNCPPCMAFTTKYCHGRHEQRKTIPCSQADFSCGLPCGRPLKCGRHKCIRLCHSGDCDRPDEPCKQPCQRSRVMCGHPCNSVCHVGDCPDTLCRENVEVLCECGNRKQQRTCHEFATDYRRIATAKLASSMQDMQRGNSIELSDVLGPIKLSNNKTLDCNEECKLVERNRKLAIGLQIRNPDLSSKLQPKYTDFVKGWAKKDPQLVQMIHDKLSELVKLAKESKQRSRSHSFPTMNREKRQLVHEMCAMFGVESVAYDAEPNRNVVANATKETSWLPSMSIMEVLQRESGVRRIPVPSNNAWGMKR